MGGGGLEGGWAHEIGSRRRGQCILDWEKSGRRSLTAINNHDGPKIHPSASVLDESMRSRD